MHSSVFSLELISRMERKLTRFFISPVDSMTCGGYVILTPEDLFVSSISRAATGKSVSEEKV